MDEMLVRLTTRSAQYKNATPLTEPAAYRYGRVSTLTVAPLAFGFLGAMSILARGVRMCTPPDSWAVVGGGALFEQPIRLPRTKMTARNRGFMEAPRISLPGFLKRAS